MTELLTALRPYKISSESSDRRAPTGKGDWDFPIGPNLSAEEREKLASIAASSLGMSVRARRIARRLKWNTALDIAETTAAKVLSIPNAGRITVRHLAFLIGEALRDDFREAGRSPESEERAVQPPTSDETILGRDPTDEELRLLEEIGMDEMGLGVRATNIGKLLKWQTARDVASANAETVFKRRNCGRKTIAEMRERVSALLVAKEPSWSKDISAESIVDFIEMQLADLDERMAFVIKERLGLWDLSGETLEDIGGFLGVTRERVRQLESKGLRQLRNSLWRRRSRRVLRDLRMYLVADAVSGDRLGIVAEAELDELLDVEQGIARSGEQAALYVALRFLETAYGEHEMSTLDGFTRGIDGLLFASPEAEERFATAVAAIRSVLVAAGKPLHPEEVAARPQVNALGLDKAQIERYCEVSTQIGQDWLGLVALRSWKHFEAQNVGAIVQRALMDLGRPSHQSTIAERTNAIAPDKRKRTPQSVSGAMLRNPGTFVSLGRGMYALRDWGIVRPPFLKDFLVGVMSELGKPMRGENLVALGQSRYGFKRTSIQMTLSMNPRIFRYLGQDLYELV